VSAVALWLSYILLWPVLSAWEEMVCQDFQKRQPSLDNRAAWESERSAGQVGNVADSHRMFRETAAILAFKRQFSVVAGLRDHLFVGAVNNTPLSNNLYRPGAGLHLFSAPNFSLKFSLLVPKNLTGLELPGPEGPQSTTRREEAMPKVLVEIKNGTVLNVEATSEDVEVYVVDHDVISDGTIGELKRYLRDLDAPADVDVVLEDELMATLEEVIAEGNARLEDRAEAWEENEDGDTDEVTDLTSVIRSRR
jgi:hypothetical protein